MCVYVRLLEEEEEEEEVKNDRMISVYIYIRTKIQIRKKSRMISYII